MSLFSVICPQCKTRERAWKAWEDSDGVEHLDRWGKCHQCYAGGTGEVSVSIQSIRDVDFLLSRCEEERPMNFSRIKFVRQTLREWMERESVLE